MLEVAEFLKWSVIEALGVGREDILTVECGSDNVLNNMLYLGLKMMNQTILHIFWINVLFHQIILKELWFELLRRTFLFKFKFYRTSIRSFRCNKFTSSSSCFEN